VTERYLSEGRMAKDIDVDITDVLLVCLAYLNWLEQDATEAFAKSLDKYKIAMTFSGRKNVGRQCNPEIKILTQICLFAEE
jgi:hypothetical protein